MIRLLRRMLFGLAVVGLCVACSGDASRETTRGLLVSTDGSQGDLLLVDPESGNSKALSQGGFGRFSNDATQVVLMVVGPDAIEVRIVDLDTGEATVVPVEGLPTWPQLSADGSLILYNAVVPLGDSGASSVPKVTNIDTGQTLTLGDDQEFRVVSPASFSPDGTQVVFAEGQALFLADPRTGALTEVAIDGWVEQATWSPDGTKIATIVSEKSQEPGVLRIVDIGDGNQVSIGSEIRAFNIAWSPDGESIAFVDTNVVEDGGGDDAGELTIVDIGAGDGSALRLGSADLWPVWSPDGTELAVTDLDGSVVIVSVASRERRVVAETGLATDWR